MKKILIIALLLGQSAFGGYTYHRPVTINHTKVPGALSSFPMEFAGTYSYLATVANGGQVQNANGYDIMFTSDAAGTAPLSCEQEQYTASSGNVTYWVGIPTLSSTADTTIYLWYGNSAISTAQCTVTGVWDSNFVLVMHLGYSLSMTDSTGNNTITSHSGVTASSGTGCVADGCGSFDGTANAYLSGPNTSSLLLGTHLTLEEWVDVTGGGTTCSGVGTPCDQSIYDKRNLSGSGKGYYLGYDRNTTNTPADGIEFYLSGSTTSCDLYAFNLTLRNMKTQWVGTYDGSTMKIYLDGSSQTTTAVGPCSSASVSTGSTDDSSATLNIDKRQAPISGYPLALNGTGDEIRISNIARSANWIATEWNNISVPSSFYSIGNASGGATVFPIIY